MEISIENGMVKAPKGEWLAGVAQPVAAGSRFAVSGLRGFVVPDRPYLRRVEASDQDRSGQLDGGFYFSSAERPFLTRMEALPDESLRVVSSKLLVAPFASRAGASRVSPIPMNRRRSFACTELKLGWAVTATKSRVTRAAVAEGDTLAVRPEAVVAWSGKMPTGFCPKLGLMDLLLPRGPKNLMLDFHGPAVVWFEGAAENRPVNFRGFRGR